MRLAPHHASHSKKEVEKSWHPPSFLRLLSFEEGSECITGPFLEVKLGVDKKPLRISGHGFI